MNYSQPAQTPPPDAVDPDAFFKQGNSYALTDDYELAIAAYTQAIQLNPTKAKYHYRRATSHFIKGCWSQAIIDYSEALRLKPDPNDDDGWNFTVDEVYHGRGMAYRYQGDYDTALVDFAELIRLQPDKPVHYRDRSVIYKIKGDFEHSMADLYTLQRLAPEQSGYFGLMADVQLRLGNKTAAMENYTKEVEQFGTPASYYYRGMLRKEMGKRAEAIADFEEAIRLYPAFYQAYLELGELYSARGDYAKAVEMPNKVMEHESGLRYCALLLRAKIHFAAGNIEQANNDFAETVEVNTTVITENPGFIQGYVIRGHAYAAQRRIQKAIADYQVALELDPTHVESDMMRQYVLKNA